MKNGESITIPRDLCKLPIVTLMKNPETVLLLIQFYTRVDSVCYHTFVCFSDCHLLQQTIRFVGAGILIFAHHYVFGTK